MGISAQELYVMRVRLCFPTFSFRWSSFSHSTYLVSSNLGLVSLSPPPHAAPPEFFFPSPEATDDLTGH